MNNITGVNAGELATNITNCILIGFNAGADILEGDGIVIIGDDIRSLDRSKNTDTVFVGDKMAIGKTVLGVDCNLYEILKNSQELSRDVFTQWVNSLRVVPDIEG